MSSIFTRVTLSLAVGAGALLLLGGAAAQAEVTRTGTLQAVVSDNFRTGESNTRYLLESGGEKTIVRPTELDAEPGDRVVVSGELENGRIVGKVEAAGAGAGSRAASEGGQALTVLPPRKVAVILYRFPGDSVEPWSPAVTRSKVFTATNSANAFFAEESYGSISLTGKDHPEGDVFGWFTLDASGSGCPYTTWNQEADQAAAAAGFDPEGYDHIVYAFPLRFSCNWGGIAGLNGTRSNLNGNVGAWVIAHELGHNLGLHHAGSWACTSGGVRVQISSTCATNEYGDPFDVMGNSSGYRHNHGWNLAKLGILAPQNVQTISVSGTYSLRSALHPTVEATVLRVPRTRSPASGAVTSWYYLEVRGSGGIFENVFDASTSGVSIRATAEFLNPETLLLDANPSTSHFFDAPLAPGQTFDGGPVQIRTVSAGAGVATVEIDVDTEPPAIPSDLQASVDANGVRLTWVGSDNVGVKRYFVFRDGRRVGNVSSPSFHEFRQPAGDFEYTVFAEDESLNKSDPSEPLTVTVPSVSGPTCAAGKCKLAYRHSGAPATWTVPPGVADALLIAEGARGGGVNPDGVGGGSGARIRARFEPLTAGQTVDISVGGRGESHSEGGDGGFNGGGDGGFGGGGGGYTKVELGSTVEVIAAGSGGRGLPPTSGAASGGFGGSGGEQGSSGGNALSLHTQGATLGGGKGGAAGGSAGAGGVGGQVSGSSECPGGAEPGGLGASGAGLLGGGGVANAGGGGGAGYVGGGQGGGGATDDCGARAAAGGGGGGSSFVAPGRLVGYEGTSGEDGWLSVEYDSPVTAAAHTHTTIGDQEIDVPAEAGVLTGASGPDGVELELAAVRQPDHGSLTLREDGSFTYQPQNGYLGTDSFVYRVSDPSGNHAEATVTLNVAGPPSATILSPPDGGMYILGQAAPTSFSCAEGVGGPGLVFCVDSNGAGAVGGGAGSLDTSELGNHAYSVTVESGSGLSATTSIEYSVVEPPEEPEQPPDEPEQPPPGPEESPEEPPRKSPAPPRTSPGLSLTPKQVSLARVLRSGRLPVVVRVRRAARLTMTGRLRVRIGNGRAAATVLVPVFRPRTIRLGGPATKRVPLLLSRRGRALLRNRRVSRIVVGGRARTADGGTGRVRAVLTLAR